MLCIYLIFVLLFLDIFEQKNIKWNLSFVQADRDPVREQLLQSSKGQVQRGAVPGARGNDYWGKIPLKLVSKTICRL